MDWIDFLARQLHLLIDFLSSLANDPIDWKHSMVHRNTPEYDMVWYDMV